MIARRCQSPQPYQGSWHVSPKYRQCWSQPEAVESSVDSHRDMGQNPLRKCKAHYVEPHILLWEWLGLQVPACYGKDSWSSRKLATPRSELSSGEADSSL